MQLFVRNRLKAQPLTDAAGKSCPRAQEACPGVCTSMRNEAQEVCRIGRQVTALRRGLTPCFTFFQKGCARTKGAHH